MNVEACVGGGDCVLKSVPIRHHETFETPIPAEDVGEEKLVGALWKAVEPRVCAHHSAGPAVRIAISNANSSDSRATASSIFISDVFR